MTKEEFKQTCSNYIGNFKEEGGEIKFYNNNRLVVHYANGEVWVDKKVYCEISLTERGSLNGYEQTYEILGGFGMPSACSTIDELKHQLDRYQFQKIKVRQLSIFDL